MAGFRKAKAEQAALKVGMYGLPGSGKTFTALLAAEGLARVTGKRVAFCDSERGTDFYAQAVKARTIHPEAFDFDALYSRSIVEISDAVRGLDPTKYGVLVIAASRTYGRRRGRLIAGA
jgi:signal recognition particle GTPase